MANSHLQPSMAAETQSMFGDLLRPIIMATSLSTPGSGLTLPAFLTTGYVRNGNPRRLVYVNQPAAPVTIAGGDGTYWLALMHDTHSAVASWAKQPGTHYAWQAAGTQPADPAGGLVMASLTVASGNITNANVGINWPWQKVAYGGPDGALAFDAELTYNEGAQILYGRTFQVMDYAGDSRAAFYTTLAIAGGTNRWAIYAGGDAPSYLGGALTVNGRLTGNDLVMNNAVGLGGEPVAGYALFTYTHSSLAANVGINMGATPATATLDVGGTVRSRGALTCDVGATLGGLSVSGPTGLQGAGCPLRAARLWHDVYGLFRGHYGRAGTAS